MNVRHEQGWMKGAGGPVFGKPMSDPEQYFPHVLVTEKGGPL